ncbi:MAG: anti-sigma factor [Burkholderiales bacterium]
MNYRRWFDRLAAEYVLGSLHGRARARFATLLRNDAELQAHVAFWERALMPMALVLSAAPSPHTWNAIAARVAPRPPTPRPGWVERWFGLRSFAPLAAGLFVGVAATLFAPRLLDTEPAGLAETQLPDSYVGVLAGANGRAGLIVSSRRHGKVLDLKQVQPVSVDAGRTLYLWVIEANGSAHGVGPVPQGAFVQVALAQTSEQLFAKAAELAVSTEAAGAMPASPSGPFIYRGLCGKLWRVPAAKR